MPDAKENAAKRALDFIGSRTKIVGLGTGSTANVFIELLSQHERAQKFECVVTSIASGKLAREKGLKVISLGELNGREIDVAVDGADWVDDKLNLIKGYGGALAREKVVDYAAKKFVVIVNKEKFVPVLKGRLPVEVLPFAAPLVEKALGEISVGGQLRKKKGSDELFVTDNGNWIFDAQFDEVVLPRDLEQDLNLIPGVVENGLFSRNISAVVVGTEDGAEVKKR